DFVAVMKPGTDVAVLVNLVGKILSSRHLESLPREKFGSPREKTDAIHAMPFCFGHQSLHQTAASALTLRPRAHRDRTNLGQVCAIKMQRTTSNDAAFIFQDDKVSYALANLRQRARQQSAVARIVGNQIVDMLGIRQDGLTRAHEPPRVETRLSSSPSRSPAAPGLAPCRRQHHGSPAPNPASSIH